MGVLVAVAGGLAFGAGVLVGMYGLAYWLKVGQWTGHTLALVFGPYAPPDSSGMAQVMVWLFSQPLWGVLLVTGAVLLVLGAILTMND